VEKKPFPSPNLPTKNLGALAGERRLKEMTQPILYEEGEKEKEKSLLLRPPSQKGGEVFILSLEKKMSSAKKGGGGGEKPSYFSRRSRYLIEEGGIQGRRKDWDAIAKKKKKGKKEGGKSSFGGQEGGKISRTAHGKKGFENFRRTKKKGKASTSTTNWIPMKRCLWALEAFSGEGRSFA